MARSTMATLITRIRLMVGDPAGGSQVFTDDEVQDILDAHRVEVRTAELIPVDSVAAGGAVSRKEFVAPRGAWESGAVLQSNSYATVAPTVADLVIGRWTFATDQTPPMYISGQVYDLWGAAGDVLEAWAAKVAREFDFATDEQTFDRSQKTRGLLRVAAEYRRKARPPATRLVTSRAAW